MPFIKGQSRPKTGGRKAGTPNKRSAPDLQRICEEMGVDPFTEMLKLAKSSRDEGIKLSCYRECSKYLYVQKRATEVSGPNETAIKVDAQSSELKETMELLTVLIDTKVNERKG